MAATAAGRKSRRLVEAGLLSAAVAAVIALAMGEAIGHPFLRGNDELETVVNNPVVHSPLPVALGAAFRTYTVGAWAPLHLISHALDRAVFGDWAGGSVLGNLVLHALAAVLVAALAARLGSPRAVSWIAAILFALHPVQVEAVVSITQRKTVLVAVFFLAALHAWISYSRAARGHRFWPYLLALGAGVAALLSKPVAVILPFALALLDLPLGRFRLSGRWLAGKLPFAVAAGALVAITVMGKGSDVSTTWSMAGHTRTIGMGGFAWYGGGPLETLLTMLTVLPRYLVLLAWPAHLSIIYLPPVRTSVDAAVVSSTALVAAIVAGEVALVRKRPRLAWWIGLFFLGLAPVAQVFPQTTLMNDRYLYFPLMGGAPLFGEGVVLLAGVSGRAGRVAVALGVLSIAIAMGFASRARVAAWSSDLSLWSDAATKAPESPTAWYNLGIFREETGDERGAVEAYRRATSLDPLDGFAASHATASLMRSGAFEEARPLAERTLRLLPDTYGAHYNVGFLRFVANDAPAARAALERAVALDPSKCEARTLLAHASALSGELERAAALYDSLQGTPCDGPDVSLYRVFVASERGDEVAASRQLTAVVRIASARGPLFLREPTLAPLLADARFDKFVRQHLSRDAGSSATPSR